MRIVKSSFSLAALWLFSTGLSSAATITFTIDPSSGNSPITPYTYGSNSNIPGVKNTYYRSGGNRLTAYNWETNWSNCGSDCNAYPTALFENDTLMGDVGDGPAGAFTAFHQANKAAGADSLVTLQLAGRVAADKAGPVPVSLFAPPDSPRFFPALLAKPGAPGSYADPPVTTDGAVYVDECVNYLVNHLGKADSGGVRFYDLDNEPGIWSGTHQEIRNNDPARYAEVAGSSAAIAYQTTAIDPGAQVLGPVGYGWGDFINLQGAPDHATYDATYDNGNWVPFLNYYLASMNSASVTAGRRLLHYLDSHVYSEGTDAAGKRINNDDVSQDAATTRMQLPRELWDPTFTETNWISCCVPNYGPMTLIPRLQAAINQHYPGTKIAFTEYSYGGGGDISGGIAEADALGIFGKYGVMASQWNTSSATPYLTCAFNLFLDYDGSGSHFGDTAVSAASGNVPLATVYAARDNSHPDRLNVIVLNKDYNTNDTASVTFTGLGGSQISSIRAFRFSSGVSVITAIAAPAFTADTLTDTLPYRSATLYELTLTQPFATATPTVTGTSTRTATLTPTGTSTPTATASPTGTLPTATFTPTRTWTPTATGTSTRTYSPTPTVVCTNLFNGCEADGVNGTWSGTGATRTFVATNKTQGTYCMQVNLATNSGWNNQTMNLTGFTPAVWSGVSQVVMDVFVSPSLISTGSTYHQFTLQADSGSYGQQPIADYPNVNANSNTVTFNISFAGAQFDASTPLTKLWFVFNTDSTGTGSFYVDNIRLVQVCNVTYTPTQTPTVTATSTATSTPTVSSTSTATRTVSMTSTPTSSGTSTATFTMTPSRTPTDTPSHTATSTSTSTSSVTSTATWTETYPLGTYTPTSQPTAAVTETPTTSTTATWTATPSWTDTVTASETSTWSPSETMTATSTPTPIWTTSRTSTSTPTYKTTPTVTSTPSPAASRTATSTETPSDSSSPTGSPTATSTVILPSPKIGIYPNPAINVGIIILSVPFGKVNEAVGIKVFTVASRLVRKTVLVLDAGKRASLGLVDDQGKSLASGLYLVVVSTAQGRAVERLLVLR